MAPISRAARTCLASLFLAGSALAAPASAPTERKVEYRIFLLSRDSKGAMASPGRVDPIFHLAADLRGEFERLGAKIEKSGSFDTPTLEGGARENGIDVLTASWTKAEYDKAAALGRGVSLIQVRIEPKTAGDARRIPASAVSAADVVAARVRKQLGIAVPPAMLRGDGLPFDGGGSRDAVADDFSRAAARLGVPVRALPADPAELAQRLHARTAPPARPQTVPPSPTTGSLKYDGLVEKAAAASGVPADVLRGLLFASNGYNGGFSKVTGLHGPMGLSLATAGDYGLDRKSVEDPEANIAAAARYFNDLKRIFGGNLSRSVAAFYCGSGTVRRSGGIPADCQGYVSQFYLAYQNGAAWAVDHDAPRYVRPVEPQEPVTPAGALAEQAKEAVVAGVHGDTPPNRAWQSKKTPPALIAMVESAAARNYFDPSLKLDPAIFLGLVWAEGGWAPETHKENPWGAVGPTQVTYSGAAPHCKEQDAKGNWIYDWKNIRAWNKPKNVECGAKVFYDRTQWTKNHDPIIGLSLYNTKSEHWPMIIDTNRVPPFKETVDYVVRAAHVACERTGKMILRQDHFSNKWSLNEAKKEELRLLKNGYPSEGNAMTPDCRLFR